MRSGFGAAPSPQVLRELYLPLQYKSISFLECGILTNMYFPSWAKNILFLLVYMISGLVLVIIIDGLLSGTELLPFNTLLEQGMVHIRTPFLTTLIVFINNVGSPFILSSIAVFIAVILAIRGNTYDALLFIVAMLMAVISVTILKNIFQITR